MTTSDTILAHIRQTFQEAAVGYQAGMLSRYKQTNPWKAHLIEVAETAIDTGASQWLQGQNTEQPFLEACEQYKTLVQEMIRG